MKLDTLDVLKDDELQSVIARAQTLLRERDEDRKAKALEQAKMLLASVGLSLKDLNVRGKAKGAKGPVYHTGHTYQHPTNKALTWNGKGKPPAWIKALEAEGKIAVEVANA